jgi:bifunctional NMN adenylyltransferase/nudix hydrolase
MLGVIVGRFQPFHNSHKELIDYAALDCDKILIIIGSAFKSRAPRNPFTYEERKGVISKIYPAAHIEPCEDFIDDFTWGEHVSNIISSYARTDTVCIYGNPVDIDFNKKFFKGGSYTYKYYESELGIRGTQVRKSLFSPYIGPALLLVPEETANFLIKFDKSILKHLTEITTKNLFNQGIYVTVDNIVTWRQHIVLIKRKDNGLYALPGGYLEKYERIVTGALRELEEETGLKRSQLKYKRNFTVDNVDRSGFGRLISFVFQWRCSPYKNAPEVIGADDAEKASWVDLNVIHHFKEKFHDDHYQIIKEGGIL